MEASIEEEGPAQPHVKKLLVFSILSIALYAFSLICTVPSHNADILNLVSFLGVRRRYRETGFLQELGRRTTFNISKSLRYHHVPLFAENVYGNRKLLVDPDRMGNACTPEDVAILQGETGPLPDGIPSFTVQIINLCVSGCPISDIHVSCGWFASAKLINPKLFKRVKFNDCVVNDKLPLKGGDSIVFEYANSFQYPLEISSVNSCCW
ncbi:hypothetical protein GOP47_0029308 [Adiantum capillus-veneris]|nr:hypothetical protein GOP47_0029308 [Adiantum capillus-veneris]